MTSPTQPASEDVGDAYSVRASRTVPAPPERVWACLCTAAGSAALLGPGALLGGKGEPWRSADGPHGVVRSYHPVEQLRVSWHATDDDAPAVVDLHVSPDGDGTRLDLVHERLTVGVDGQALQQRWNTALDRLAAVATG